MLNNNSLYMARLIQDTAITGRMNAEESFGDWADFEQNYDGKKLVCYGTGQLLKYFIRQYKDKYKVSYAVDKKANYDEYIVEGVRVKQIENIAKEKDVIILITLLDGVGTAVEKTEYLGIPKENIFVLVQMEMKNKELKDLAEQIDRDDVLRCLSDNVLELNNTQRQLDIMQHKEKKLLNTVVHSNNIINALIDRLDDRELKIARITDMFHRLYDNTYVPDLNNPKTFNEKLLALSLEDDEDRLYATVTDKYTFKEYVSNIVGKEYVVPLLGVWDSPDEIDYDKLPDRFVIKATNGGDSTRVVLVHDKKTFDLEALNYKMRPWVSKYDNVYYWNFNGIYKHVSNRIIAEEMLDIDDNSIFDYKVHCFNGIPKLVHVVRQKPHQVSFYDMNWERQDVSFAYPYISHEVERPAELDLMIELSRKLSKPFRYVRVDFYLLNGKVYVGELTLTNMGGLARFEPQEWDRKLGEMIE